MIQTALDFDAPRAAGEVAGQRSLRRANRTDPEFAAKAEAAIVAHLKVVGRASGEDLTHMAKAKGATPPDDRAFGPIYASLARRGVIRTAGFCARLRGHGTAGGRIWALSEGVE